MYVQKAPDFKYSDRFYYKLATATKCLVALWLIAQIAVMVLYWGAPQYSDASNYARFASESLEAGSIYPTVNHFNDIWVANTGYVNFLVLNLYLFGTLNFVPVIQLVLNCVFLWSLFRLASRFGNKTIGCLTVMAFCLLPSNILDVTVHMSDLMCCSLFMLSLVMMRKSPAWLIAAGAIAAIANWSRPIGIIYWPSALLIGYIICRKDGIGHGRIAALGCFYILGIVIVNAGIMCATKASCGYALSGSTTKGTNMIIGCNDLADGGYNDQVFLPGNAGYIADSLQLDAVQRDSELTHRSIEWVKEHPARFAALAPVKIFRLWCGDYYADKVLAPAESSARTTMPTVAAWSLTYYAMLLAAACGIWAMRRRLWGIPGLILLPVLMGTAMHLLMYGGMRYHYPMMPPLYWFAAIAVLNFFPKTNTLSSQP